MKNPLFILLFGGLCLLGLIPYNVAAQEKHVVSGNIADGSNGEAMIGTTVVLLGTTQGTVTDLDGNFSLSVNTPYDTILVSAIGYTQLIIPLEGRSSLEIVMEVTVEELDEVVVIGYGTQKKADLTGAVSTISSSDITSTPVASVAQAIQGRAAGVQVVNSGSPGGGVSIKIRGTGTINNSDPLYVVDGFIVEDINHLSNDDIKDLQILKDASSTAIYGARAANGVVLITTKGGSVGKTRVDFNAYMGRSEVWQTPHLMDQFEFVEFWEEANPGALYFEQNHRVIFDEFAAGSWYDRILRQGLTQKYSLQVSGGTEKNTYMLSGNWNAEEGTVLNSDFTKKGLRLVTNSQITKKIRLNANIHFLGSENKRIWEEQTFSWATSASPAESIYNTNLMVLSNDGSELLSYEEVYSWNPYRQLVDYKRESGVNQYTANFALDIDLLKGLKNRTLVGMEYRVSNDEEFGYNRSPDFKYIFWPDFGDNAVYNRDVKRFKWQAESIMTYQLSLDGHNFSMVGGVVFEGYNASYLWASRAMAPGTDPSFQSLDATYLNPELGGYSREWFSVGIPARIDYNFNNRYLLQANFRADASSVFAAENRWGYFPSVSAGWKISEESFLETVDWLSLLKLRASWGTSGNSRIDEYASMTLINTNTNQYFVYGKDFVYRPGWSANSLGNSEIQWEKTSSLNFGLDISTFRNSLSASVEVFDKLTSDMLLRLPVVLSTGMTYGPWQNAGEVRNRGIEFTLNAKRSFGDFSAEFNGNLSKIENRVVRLGDFGEPVSGGSALGAFATYTVEGQPVGMFYGWKIDRSINENGIWQAKDLETIEGRILPGNRPATEYIGDFMFKDLNGDNRIDENDKTFLGSPHPDLMYGLNFTFNYKGFDLVAFFQGVYGVDVLNTLRETMYAYKGNNNTVTGLKDMVYTPDNEDALYPKTKLGPDYNLNFRMSDFYIEDGSYLRLKNLQLGYYLPDKLCRRIGMSTIRFYFSAYNLLTFTDYSGFDPEISNVDASGRTDNTGLNIDYGTYPVAKTLLLGISVGF